MRSLGGGTRRDAVACIAQAQLQHEYAACLLMAFRSFVLHVACGSF